MHIFRRSIAEGGKDGAKGFVKRVTSTFSIRKKKNTTTTTTSDPKLLLPRSKSTGANYESMRLPQGKKSLPDVTSNTTKSRTKSAGVSPQPRREKIDATEKQFMKLRCFDDSDSIWLSSDCASTSSLLEERRVSVSFHFSVDEKIVSWLSNVAKSSLSLNQEATKENHHPHQKSSKNAKCSSENIRKDGKICNSAGKSVGTGSAKPSSSRLPESKNKTCLFQKQCQESSSSNKIVSPDLTSSQSPEEKKVSFSVESDKSPSPVGPSKTIQASTTLEKVAEIGESKRKVVVEPLFWPLEQKFDWTPEDILKHFSMSPRRKKSTGSKSAGTSPRSMRAQLQTRKLDLKEGCKRKLMFNGPGSNSKPTRIPELKRTISNNTSSTTKNAEISNNLLNSVKRNKSLPSRLRKSSKISSKVVPIEATAEETGEIAKGQKTPKKLILTRKSRTFLEDDFALMNDFSIENAVGLCEFKGREGIDSDFNADGFLFDDSL